MHSLCEMCRNYRHNRNSGTLERGEIQLEVRELGIAFGGVPGLENVSLKIRQGEIHAVIDPTAQARQAC